MNPEVRITRAGPTSPEAPPIAESEWRTAVDEDPELESLEQVVASHPDGSTFADADPQLACWNGHPSGERVWFCLRGGDIVLKNPDDACLVKLEALASVLDGM